jgi:hypothetical protein
MRNFRSLSNILSPRLLQRVRAIAKRSRTAIALLTLMLALALASIRFNLPVGISVSAAEITAIAPAQAEMTRPVRQIPGLLSLTFWERTGAAPVANTFAVNSPQMENRLNDPLGPGNRDFAGFASGELTEAYDVFYSNADGTPNRDGAYVTVEAVWERALPAGGGLNIAEVQLDFAQPATPPEYAYDVTSFVGLGDNFIPASISNAVDGDLQTHTTMGNTVGQTRRLRITVAFASSVPPPPPTLAILDTEVVEGNAGTTDAVLRVGLNRLTDSDVTVDYTTAGFSAVAGRDYIERAGTLTIPAGSLSRDITVQIIGDTLPEWTQAFFVRLSNVRGATISDGEGVCGIIDDDDPGVISICSSEPTITIDRDVMVDDLEVSLHVSNSAIVNDIASLSLWQNSRETAVALTDTLAVFPGSGLGSTCSPVPDCVLSDDVELRRIEVIRPPRVGRWLSRGLQRSRFVGTNARGRWGLDLRTSNPSTVLLRCWCLGITGAREGLRLEPKNAMRTVFTRFITTDGDLEALGGHQIKAVLNRNGGPAEGIPITFTIRDQTGRVLEFRDGQNVVTTNSQGRAFFAYQDWVPGQHTIEARAELDGAIYTDIARVTWTNPCVATASLQGTANAEASLNTMRSFHDSKLAKSKRGREYSQLYYKLSSEAIRLMMFNPMLMLRSQEMIERYLPVVRDMAEGRDVALTEGDLAEIDGFLSCFAAKGSSEFKQSLDGLREDLRSPEVHREFSVRITPGPRREIHGGGPLQSLKHAGAVTTLSGFVFALGYCIAGTHRRKVGTRRRKTLRRARAGLGVLLVVLLVGGNCFAASIEYSTYLGGAGDDEGTVMAVDSEGNVYVAGITDSLDLPATGGGQSVFGGGSQDLFVAKLDPTGSRLIYLTYLGGAGQETATGIALDSLGNAYVTGFTDSTNFPALNALQPDNRGGFDGFVVKLGPAGNLIYSTYLGGSANDAGSGIAIDASGNICLSGITTSQNFPTASALQQDLMGASDLYVAKLSAAGDRLLYSTYLGGSQDDAATSLAADPAGNVYVTGATLSSDFRTANASQRVHGGGIFDGFVAKLNPTGSQLVYSTYLGGGSADRCMRIAADSAGNAYVTGDTRSANFPAVGVLQRTSAGSSDAFVSKLNPNGSLAYSTYLGGSGIDGGAAIAVGANGSAYVTGFTDSTNFPTAGPVQPANAGGSFDAFVAKLDTSGSALTYSTYLGGAGTDSGFGVAVDSTGSAYVMGLTDSTNFPTERALQAANRGGVADLFIAKLRSGPAINSAEVKGKKLIVTGNEFDAGARILVDGQAQKTANDAENPSSMLIAKKAGKNIARGQRVTLQVRNPDGSLSPEFSFMRPAQ